MSEFLSDEWFATIEATASSVVVPAGLSFSIEQVITGDEPIRWQVRIGSDGVEIDRNPSAVADVRISTDRTTATRIQTGDASAQRAFLDGRLQIGGDIQALMAHRQTLADLAPALGLA